MRDIFLHARTMQKNITALCQHIYTLSHHDDLRHTIRNQVTPQKPSQIRNFWHHAFQVHNQDNNSLSAIALIRRIFLDRLTQPPRQFFPFFGMARCGGDLTFSLLVSYCNATNCLVYLSTSSTETLCNLPLLWVPPSCPVSWGFGRR